MDQFTGVKVFSATMAKERDMLGEKVTGWLKEHRGIAVTDRMVLQSSDQAFHCISIVIFYKPA